MQHVIASLLVAILTREGEHRLLLSSIRLRADHILDELMFEEDPDFDLMQTLVSGILGDVARMEAA